MVKKNPFFLTCPFITAAKYHPLNNRNVQKNICFKLKCYVLQRLINARFRDFNIYKKNIGLESILMASIQCKLLTSRPKVKKIQCICLFSTFLKIISHTTMVLLYLDSYLADS